MIFQVRKGALVEIPSRSDSSVALALPLFSTDFLSAMQLFLIERVNPSCASAPG